MSPAELSDAQALTALLHAEIPLSAYMQVRVAELGEGQILLAAPFEPNRNIHGTGFAGSLYTLCVLAGWSLLSAWLARRGLAASVVAHKAQIEYLAPVAGELAARCALPEAEALAQFEARFAARGKARLPLRVAIGEGVSFSADFVAVKEPVAVREPAGAA